MSTKPARSADLAKKDEQFVLNVAGDWSLQAADPGSPDPAAILAKIPERSSVFVILEDGTTVGSPLAAFLLELHRLGAKRGIQVQLDTLPNHVQKLVEMALMRLPELTVKPPSSLSLFEKIVHAILRSVAQSISILSFIGECARGITLLIIGRSQTRRHDILALMQQTGANALPLVLLINCLVGMILGFVGVVQLRTFGAAIYVADLVALAMLREMGALMTAIILAGRTGASYAAELGTMQVSQEIDALRVLGICPIQFLVVPRLVALTLMLPILTTFGDAIGLAGGAAVATSMLDITLRAYWNQTILWVTVKHFNIGLVKAFVFGGLVAFWGCFYGMQAGRSAEEVGKATTRAVVSSITSLIAADAVFAVVLSELNI